MKYNFRFFIKEGAGNMFSHGFMSFAAIGISVACLLIMGTFTLVAYNANENLSDLQQENAVVAFVDDSLTETQARDLQAQLEKVDNVADCTFMSRDEAKENYIENTTATSCTATCRQMCSATDMLSMSPTRIASWRPRRRWSR